MEVHQQPQAPVTTARSDDRSLIASRQLGFEAGAAHTLRARPRKGNVRERHTMSQRPRDWPAPHGESSELSRTHRSLLAAIILLIQ